MVPIRTLHQVHLLPLRNGYIVDGRIAWWKVQSRRQAIVMAVIGELDASNSKQFEASIDQLVSSGEPFVIDLADVDFMSSPAIRPFFKLVTERVAARPWGLVVPSRLQALLRICDPNEALPVASCLADALRDVAMRDSGVVRLLPRMRSAIR
ncbi:STAS domain-containing protein [Mycobacterium sp. OAE908]|uniref:STAS domain-containing protein n=1 Tax=Mycobacterium sp. OAE908 TaxID=2817899 RepID=UPI001AE6FA86